MNARYYIPGLGRFLTADTIVPDPNNPQQYNRYTYVLGNPLAFFDPTGHAGCRLGQRCVGNNGPISPPQKPAPLSLSTPPTPAPATPTTPPPTPVPLNSNAGSPVPTPAPATPSTVSLPSSSASRAHGWPDYVTLQGSFLIFSGSVTMDTYSNVYGSVGLSGGVETAYLLGGSIRLSAGYIVAEHYSRGYGPSPNQMLGFRPATAPTEAELEAFNRGFSLGGGGGFGLGADISVSIDNSTKGFIGLEPGLYSPQLGGGVTYGFFLYDARDNGGKYFWELWFE